MRACLTYVSIVVITICCLALTPSSVRAQRDQIGASPQQASPEIVRQMKQESRQEFTAAERAEFKKLHAADAEAFRQIAALMTDVANNSRRYTVLEGLISGLDTTIDTRRLLIKNTTDIADLQKSREADKEDRKTQNSWLLGIASGILLLYVAEFLKWRGGNKAAEARDTLLVEQLVARFSTIMEAKSNRHKALGIS